MLLFQGHKESVSGLAWKATGLAKLSFKCNPAVQGISERVVEVFKGGVLCTALKCGVPQVRLNLKLNLESGVLHLLQFHVPPREFMWLWRGLCLEAPDLPSCHTAGVHRCNHQSHSIELCQNGEPHLPLPLWDQHWSPTGQVIMLEAEVWHQGERSVVCIVSPERSRLPKL